MNLLSQFDELFNRQEKAVAKVTQIKADGEIIAQTLSGAIVLLNGTAHGTIQVGNNVYYDRRSGTVLSVAPDVVFGEWGV